MKNKFNNVFFSECFVFFAVIIFVFARAPSRVVHGYLWAEDASIFIKQSYQLGLYSLFKPYAGYLHLLPRVIVNLACALVDIIYIPYLLSCMSLFLTGLASWYLYRALKCVSGGVALMVAFSLVATPQNGELLFTITNLQWVLCPVVLILLWECSVSKLSLCGSAVRAFVLGVLTLTGPFGVLFSPLLLVYFVLNRLWRFKENYIWFAPYAISVMFQLWVIFNYPQSSSLLVHDHFFQILLIQFFSDFCSFSVVHGHNHIYLNVGLGVCFFVLILWSVYQSKCRSVIFLLLVVSVVLWFVGIFRVGNLDMHLSWRADGSRYLYLPLLFMVWAIIFTYHYSVSKIARNISVFFLLLIFIISMTKFSLNEWSDCIVVKRNQGAYIMSPMSDGVYIKREFL